MKEQINKEDNKKNKKFFYGLTLFFIVLILGWAYMKNQSDNSYNRPHFLNNGITGNSIRNPQEKEIKDTTISIKALERWFLCWQEDSTSNLNINYELSSNQAIDVIFTPTKNDIENFNENSKHYSTCYAPSVLKNNGDCIIQGTGCMALYNKGLGNAIVDLKYSAEKV